VEAKTAFTLGTGYRWNILSISHDILALESLREMADTPYPILKNRYENGQDFLSPPAFKNDTVMLLPHSGRSITQVSIFSLEKPRFETI
jgi:hypothetical protein